MSYYYKGDYSTPIQPGHTQHDKIKTDDGKYKMDCVEYQEENKEPPEIDALWEATNYTIEMDWEPMVQNIDTRLKQWKNLQEMTGRNIPWYT